MTYTNRLAKKEWDERASTLEGAMKAILDQYEGDIETFYESGKKHVNDMMLALRKVGVYPDKSMSACEIGVGAGRCSIWFSDIFKKLYGTDISPNMIGYANRFAKRDNVEYITTSTLRDVPEKVDMVVSHIVLQHISKVNFWLYIEDAYHILNAGGVFCTQVHITKYPHTPDDSSTILVRGYSVEEISESLDFDKWESLGIGLSAGESEVWRWLILRKK